ncbi:hypothetical protein DLAC_05255 [Tieghemostelium lacteum]|uniref:Uncharacterized protein n=1 Tax=Tieghemostelium lacteum TaxID=361077 RepID=A0A151ZIX1_TIELA|nr:hypothetical protein DLAC_05255 [Tieghemostelium lacteum]|eukprot:KYQ93855.1 hypothetical protein DLAC_05255 [Tieghemostelium lacteum]
MSEINNSNLVPSCPIHLRTFKIFRDYKNKSVCSGCPLQFGDYYGRTIDEFSISVPKILDGNCNEACRSIVLKQLQITQTWVLFNEEMVKNTILGIKGEYPTTDKLSMYKSGRLEESEEDKQGVYSFFSDLSFLENYHYP